MDTDELDHQRQLREKLRKRLRLLQLRKAAEGRETSPAVLSEIDEINEQIVSIDKLLLNIEKYIPQAAQQENSISFYQETLLRIVLGINYSAWNPDLEDAAIRAFAAVMQIPPDNVQIMKVLSGSVILIIKVPSTAAMHLLQLYRNHDPILEGSIIEQVAEFSIVDIGIFNILKDAVRQEGSSIVQGNQRNLNHVDRDSPIINPISSSRAVQTIIPLKFRKAAKAYGFRERSDDYIIHQL